MPILSLTAIVVDSDLTVVWGGSACCGCRHKHDPTTNLVVGQNGGRSSGKEDQSLREHLRWEEMTRAGELGCGVCRARVLLLVYL